MKIELICIFYMPMFVVTYEPPYGPHSRGSHDPPPPPHRYYCYKYTYYYYIIAILRRPLSYHWTSKIPRVLTDIGIVFINHTPPNYQYL